VKLEYHLQIIRNTLAVCENDTKDRIEQEIRHVVAEAVQEAVSAEREACQNAMCSGCANGERLIKEDGWQAYHPGDPTIGQAPAYTCGASAIRARGKGKARATVEYRDGTREEI